jgi:hypothetical protein
MFGRREAPIRAADRGEYRQAAEAIARTPGSRLTGVAGACAAGRAVGISINVGRGNSYLDIHDILLPSELQVVMLGCRLKACNACVVEESCAAAAC